MARVESACDKDDICWTQPAFAGSISESEFLLSAGQLTISILAPNNIVLGGGKYFTFLADGSRIGFLRPDEHRPAYIYKFESEIPSVLEAIVKLHCRKFICFLGEIESAAFEHSTQAFRTSVRLCIHLSMRAFQHVELRGESRRLFGCLVTHLDSPPDFSCDAERSERLRLAAAADCFAALTRGPACACAARDCPLHPSPADPAVRARFRLGHVLNCLSSAQLADAAPDPPDPVLALPCLAAAAAAATTAAVAAAAAGGAGAGDVRVLCGVRRAGAEEVCVVAAADGVESTYVEQARRRAGTADRQPPTSSRHTDTPHTDKPE